MEQVKAIPHGMHTITPHLVCAGAAEAIEFYKKAFNAREVSRAAGADGKLINALIFIGDSAMMLIDEFPHWCSFSPKSLKGSPVTIHLYVEDVDKAFAQAVSAGASVIMPPDNMFWGDRYGVIVDPFGHKWSIATHIRDVSAEEIQAAAQACGDKACDDKATNL